MSKTSAAASQAQLHAWLRAEYGLDLSRGGTDRSLAEHVEARLAALGPQADELGLLERVLANVEGERERLIHAITVQHTWFFRDPDQLDEIAKFFQTRHRELGRPLEVWVVGCATGEEAWTLAMIADTLAVPIRLLATDVDTRAIADAQSACYREARLHGLPPAMRHHFLDLGDGRWRLDVAALLGERSRVEFAIHNICDPPPPGRSFDLVCCRNVLIYLEFEPARSSVARLRSSLRPQGRLVLGSADLLTDPIAHPRLRDPSGSRPSASPPSPKPSRPPLAEPVGVAKIAEPRGPDDLTRASQAIASGRADEALVLLEALVVDESLQAEVQFWIGLAHHHAGRPVPAIVAFRRAACLAPELWPASLFAALAHERLADAPAAQRCWVALGRALQDPRATPIHASVALADALPGWRGEALALARIRASPIINSRSKP